MNANSSSSNGPADTNATSSSSNESADINDNDRAGCAVASTKRGSIMAALVNAAKLPRGPTSDAAASCQVLR